jgi:hypothetical protein
VRCAIEETLLAIVSFAPCSAVKDAAGGGLRHGKAAGRTLC